MKLYYSMTGLFALYNIQGAEAVGGRKLGQTKDILSVITGMSSQNAKNFLRNYGCYCYPLSAQKAGPAFNYNGDPVDELDDLCKKLYRAQKCIDIDVAEGNYETECTLDQGYGFYTDDNGQVVCGAEENQGERDDKVACRVDMCELEKDFAEKVAALINSGYTHNNGFKNMDEAEYQASCPRTQNGNNAQVELSCCGTGISRRTYNTITSDCCDNRVESLGSC
jgi:hypothetical protein